jgi:hypothetical protein
MTCLDGAVIVALTGEFLILRSYALMGVVEICGTTSLLGSIGSVAGASVRTMAAGVPKHQQCLPWAGPRRAHLLGGGGQEFTTDTGVRVELLRRPANTNQQLQGLIIP